MPRSQSLWIQLPSGLANGLTIKVDPRFHVGYLRGDHEPWVQDLLRQHLRPGDAYFDIGAHIGFFVLCAATLVGEHGRIVAMEPDAQNFKNLVANIERNRLHHVTALQAAAWNATGRVKFTTPFPRSARSEGKVFGENSSVEQSSSDENLGVPSLRLDDIPGPTPAVVKIDIEGAEIEACKGAERLLAQQSTVWIVEAHSDTLAAELHEMFNRHGYDLTTTSPRHPVYGQYRETYVIAQPQSPVRKGA
jgi:FkbM family methyltransferase